MADDFNPTEWITTKEAAELTGYTDAYIRQLIGRRRLQAKKRGRDWFLSKSDILAYGAKCQPKGLS